MEQLLSCLKFRKPGSTNKTKDENKENDTSQSCSYEAVVYLDSTRVLFVIMKQCVHLAFLITKCTSVVKINEIKIRWHSVTTSNDQVRNIFRNTRVTLNSTINRLKSAWYFWSVYLSTDICTNCTNTWRLHYWLLIVPWPRSFSYLCHVNDNSLTN